VRNPTLHTVGARVRSFSALIPLLLALTACMNRPASPHLSERHCAPGSYPYRGFYRGQLVVVCAIPDPFCVDKAKNGTQPASCPIAGFIALGEPNPVLDPDGDDGSTDQMQKRRRSWWRFWHRDRS